MMSKRILLIDDDKDEHDIFKEAINMVCLHCQCFCTYSAEQAIKLLNNLIPDFIFLDINMPKMNGFECLSTIKSMEVYKDIPIILYSTGATENMKSKAIMLGAKDCIAKTNSIQSLADALQKIL